MPDRSIASFIIRFVRQESEDHTDGRWIGLVRHVQTGTEERFVDMAQALIFMERLLAGLPAEESHS